MNELGKTLYQTNQLHTLHAVTMNIVIVIIASWYPNRTNLMHLTNNSSAYCHVRWYVKCFPEQVLIKQKIALQVL